MWVLPLLDVTSRMIQTKKIAKKSHFGSDLGPLRQISMVNYHHVQYQKKLMIQSSENLGMDGQTDERQ